MYVCVFIMTSAVNKVSESSPLESLDVGTLQRMLHEVSKQLVLVNAMPLLTTVMPASINHCSVTKILKLLLSLDSFYYVAMRLWSLT